MSDVSPDRLPDWLRPYAAAIDVDAARSPGFFRNHVDTGVRVQLDCTAAVLPDDVQLLLQIGYGPRLTIVCDAHRSQFKNLTDALQQLASHLEPVFAAATPTLR